MKRVSGKVAMVTGGASGLGEAMVRVLAAHGARVVIADVNATQGEALAQSVAGQGGEALFLPLDVTDEQQWEEVMEQTVARFGKLSVLVNNAGIAPVGDMDMDYALWKKVMAVNLDGTFLGTRAAIRTMVRCQERGSIINISSTMAMVAEPTTAAYSASKGGVRSLTKAAAMHCAAKGFPIRVNSIHPGMCLTPLVKSYLAQHPEALQPQIDSHPIGHLGEAEDIAYGVLFLASEESKFMLGSELVIDGGYLMK